MPYLKKGEEIMSEFQKKARLHVTIDQDVHDKILARAPHYKVSTYVNNILKTWFEVVDDE
jgi:hypothetical protein